MNNVVSLSNTADIVRTSPLFHTTDNPDVLQREVNGRLVNTYTTSYIGDRAPHILRRHGDENTTSAQFRPYCTADIMRKAEQHGFRTYAFRADGRRKDGLHATARHMVGMVGPHNLASGTAETLYIMNASDGTKSLQIAYGGLVGACFNTLFFGDVVAQSGRILHKGKDFVENVRKSFEHVLSQRQETIALISDMSGRLYTPDDKAALVETARELRPAFDNVAPNAIVAPRRLADNRHDLYSLYNRTQEAVIRGGNVNRETNRTMRAVRNTNDIARFNRALWNTAQERLAA